MIRPALLGSGALRRAVRSGGRGAVASALAGAAVAVLLAGCGGGNSTDASVGPNPNPNPNPGPQTAAWQWNLPDYFAPPIVPVDNPMTQAKVDLGRYLFNDRRLSGNGTQACGSCHQQSKGFSDGQAVAIGSTGVIHPRGAMALVNVAWNTSYTWGNNALPSLERQIPNPIWGTTPVELGVDDVAVEVVLARLRSAKDVDYPALFARAFPESKTDPVSWYHITQAITSFERTLISVGSKYDQVRQGKASFTPQEEHGFQVFKNADCIKCHREPNFTDQFVTVNTPADQITMRYYNKGLYNVGGTGDYPFGNQGIIELTLAPQDMGKFKTPTLRNIEVTGPYTHDGSVATLEEAVDIFTGGGRNVTTGPDAGDGRASPHKSRLIQDRDLTPQDKADLVAFLKTLTDREFLTNPKLSDPFATGAAP